MYLIEAEVKFKDRIFPRTYCGIVDTDTKNVLEGKNAVIKLMLFKKLLNSGVFTKLDAKNTYFKDAESINTTPIKVYIKEE